MQAALNGAPASWRKVTLGEIYDIGSSKRVLQKQWKDSGVPFYRAREIVKLARDGFVANDLFISEAHFEELEKAKGVPQPGDLMVSAVGTLGACYAVQPGDRFYFKDASVLSFRPIAPIDPRFMQYAFLWHGLLDQVKSGEGATVGTFTITRAKATEFLLPPLDEQKRIVAVLDQAFAALDRARAHAEANRESCRELFGTLLEATLRRDAAGWKRLPLKSLGTTQTGTTPKASEAESYGDFIPFIKPGDFKLDGSLELENQGLSELGAKKARTVPAGSALMVCIGATIGKAGFTETEIVTNQQINAVFPREGISGEFLYYQFITPSFQREVMRRSGQATLPIINKSKWSEIEVAFSSDLATQARIVESLRAIRRHTEELVGRYDQNLADIANLRQSLLQKAFSGELT